MQQSSARIGHALDYSRSRSDYAQRAKTVTPEFAQTHVEEIGRNITVAQKELTLQRKEGEASGDKETITNIAKDVKAASEAHANCEKRWNPERNLRVRSVVAVYGPRPWLVVCVDSAVERMGKVFATELLLRNISKFP